MYLRKLGMAVHVAVVALAMTLPLFPETTNQWGEGHAVVTVLPADNNNASIDILKRDLQIKVNGKQASITDWKPLRGPNSNLEMVILIDGSARASLGRQLDDISGFIRSLPANEKVTVGYMNAGRAVLTGPLSTNHAEVARQLRVPGGVAGSNASPYFCLSDLARNWPSTDRSARREAILITNGVDNYYQGFDPENPYLKKAIHDSVRAGLVVYSIYAHNRGRGSNTGYQSFVGQSLLVEVTRATGGHSYWEGTSREPVSYRPYFDDIARRLQNQYQLRFRSPLEGKRELQTMNLDVGKRDVRISAPRQVLVARPNAE